MSTGPRSYMTLRGRALEELAHNSSGSSEPIGSDELDRLAALMFAAYAGTTDDEGETVSDHRTEITRTRRGAYGPYLPSASRWTMHDGEPVSAALTTSWRGAPFVAFLVTHPRHSGRGHARRLMADVAAAVLADGHDMLSLVVTDADPAARLYAHLGFVRADRPQPDAGSSDVAARADY
jgi:GNAT superfamily N-acetyltransferase